MDANNDVSLRFVNFDFNPVIITEALSVPPTISWGKNDEYFVSATGRRERRPNGLWLLRIRDSETLEDPLRGVGLACKLIALKSNRLECLLGDKQYRMDVCIWKEGGVAKVEFHVDELKLIEKSKVHGVNVTFVGTDYGRGGSLGLQLKVTLRLVFPDLKMNGKERVRQDFRKVVSRFTRVIVYEKRPIVDVVFNAKGRHAWNCNCVLNNILEALRVIQQEDECSSRVADRQVRVESLEIQWDIPHSAVYIPRCLIENLCTLRCQNLKIVFNNVSDRG